MRRIHIKSNNKINKKLNKLSSEAMIESLANISIRTNKIYRKSKNMDLRMSFSLCHSKAMMSLADKSMQCEENGGVSMAIRISTLV